MLIIQVRIFAWLTFSLFDIGDRAYNGIREQLIVSPRKTRVTDV